MNDYLQYLDKNASESVWIALPLIIATFIISCILIPCLLKNLRGHSKVYLILQNLSANVFLIMMAIPAMTAQTRPKDFASLAAGGYRIEGYVEIATIFKNIFHYQQYSYQLLQSLNFYNMICKPLQYGEYSKSGRVVKRVVACLLFSCLLSVPTILERMALTFILFYDLSIHVDHVKDLAYFNWIYNCELYQVMNTFFFIHDIL